MNKTEPVTPLADYLRLSKFPFIWCPGCGHGIIVQSFLRVLKKLAIHKEDVDLISGIGCSSRAPGYLDFNTLHTTHGRAIAFATVIKLTKPHLHVVVVTGDGDAAAIGGNHLIHACRRNIDITVLVFNNYIYGMTGGQVSPTTPRGMRASTAPYGSIDPPFDIANLAAAAGASFVGRTTVFHTPQLDRLIEQALKKKGFSLVEVLSNCPIAFGRRNKIPHPFDLMEFMKKRAVPVAKAKDMTPEELEGKFTTGVLADRERPEYVEQYMKLCEKVQGS